MLECLYEWAVCLGLRGAIAFSLAIRNTDSAARQLILDATLIIVFVTVFVNGGLTTQMLLFFKIRCNYIFYVPVVLMVYCDLCVVELELRMMKRNTNFRPFQW